VVSAPVLAGWSVASAAELRRQLVQDNERRLVRVWLRRVKPGRGPAGHLITDMQQGDALPLFGSIGELREYLLSQGACPAAEEAVPVAWRRYRSWRRRVADRGVLLLSAKRGRWENGKPPLRRLLPPQRWGWGLPPRRVALLVPPLYNRICVITESASSP
jgi:hypothetical protein